MKSLSATAAGTTPAPVERCFELLVAIDGYPRWYPSGVRSAAVLERGPDALPTRARAELHLAHGPLVKDFRLELAVVTARPTSVQLRRIPHGGGDQEELTVAWRLSAGVGTPTRIAVELAANLSVPRFLPVGGVAESLAQGFLTAALAAL
jgi:Polyketide cyclase / dehydrase and lipid transport